MLPARHRLRTAAQFKTVVRSGSRAAAPAVVLHVSPRTVASSDPVEPTRVGFIVSKSIGNAVTRNRVKRQLRHLCAHRLSGWQAGCDIVVRARPGIEVTKSAEIGAQLDACATRVWA